MNRIYKVIWNEALNCFTAVGEYAKARGKYSKSSVSANATINTTENLLSTSAFKLTAIGLGLMAAGFCIQANAASDFEGDIGGKLDASIQLNIVGGESNPINLTDNNIGVVGSGGGDGTTPNNPKTLTIKLAKDIDLTDEGSLTIGDTLVDNSGITITNIVPAKTVSLTSTGLNNGGNQITNVFSGGAVETNAANIGDVNRVVSANRIKYFSVKSTGGTNEDNLGAQGVDAIAIGKNASAVGQTTVTIGTGSGTGSTVNTREGVSVGNASGQNVLSSGNVGIGASAGSNVSATPRTTVGGNPAYRPYSIVGQNTAIGAAAGNGVYGDSNSALGERAGRNVDGHANTAIGAFSGNAVIGSANVAMGPTAGYTVTGDRNTAVGNFSGSHVVGKANSAFGNGAGSNVTGEYNLALGATAGAGITSNLSIAIGNNAGNIAKGNVGESSISVGTNSSAQGLNSMAIGRGSVSAGENATGIGVQAKAEAKNSVAIGQKAKANGISSVAIGEGAEAIGINSIAIGTGNKVIGNNSGAFGDPNEVGGTDSYAFGNDNTINNNNTFVLGNNVSTTQNNSVVLGNLSTDRAATTETGVIINTRYYTYGGQGSAAKGVVSVGFVNGERQIINVAAGAVNENSTDAINGSQLYATNQSIEEVNETANKGWFVRTDSGDGAKSNVKPDDVVTINGDNKNISVTNVGNDLIVALSDDISVGTSGIDGKDGFIGVNGKDGVSGVAINGSNGTIGLTGPTGVSGTIGVINGVPGVNGGDGITRIVIDDIQVATMEDGLKFAGNTGTTINKKLNETLSIEGKLANAADASGANLRVDSLNGKLNVVMAKNLTDLDTVTVGSDPSNQTFINRGTISSKALNVNAGRFIVEDDKVSMALGTNVSMGGNQVHNVVAGAAGTDAVNVDQLNGQNTTIVTKGLNFAGNDNINIHKDLGTQLKIVGSLNPLKTASAKNIRTVENNGQLEIQMADALDVTSVTTGNTVMDNGGVSFINSGVKLNSTGFTITNIVPAKTVSLTSTGLNNGGNQITNVFSGGAVETNAANIGDVQTIAGGLKTIVAAGTNVASVTKTTALNGQDTYTVNAKGTTASAGSDAVTVTPSDKNATTNLTDYKVDLSTATKTSLSSADSALQSVVTQIDGTAVKTITKANNTANFLKGDNILLTPESGGIKVALAKDLTGLTSVTTGNTVMNTSGITLTGGINQTVTLSNSGLNNGGNQITNVKAGTEDMDAVNVGQLNLTNTAIDKGLNFGGDSGTDVNRKLGQKLIVKGGDTINADPATKNISVTANGDDTLTVRLAKDINLGETGSVTTGNTQVNNAGITLYRGDNGQVVLTNNGLNNGGNQITNVLSGGETLTNAANIGDLKGAVSDIATKGLDFAGNDGINIHKDLGQKLEIVGTLDASKTASAKNIRTVANNGKLEVQLADALDVTSVTTGNAFMNNNGFTFVSNGSGRTVILSSRGLDNGGNIIRNVGTGLLNSDAVNVGQLREVTIALDQGWGITAQGDIATMVKQGGSVDMNSRDGNIKVSRTLISNAAALDSSTGLRVAAIPAGANDLSFDLNPDLTVDSLTTGDTTINSNGLTIAGGPSVTKSGIDAADKKITNVRNGSVSASSQDAINGSQLYAQGSGISSIIGGNTVYNPVDGTFTNSNIGGTGEGSIDGAIGSIRQGTIEINENVQVNTTNIETNTINIATNTRNIVTNTTNIATNTTNIKSNTDKLDAGLNFGADSGANINKPIGDESVLIFKGGNNITTTSAGSSIKFDLNGNINVDSVTTGDTTVSTNGVVIAGGSSITKAGIYAGNGETAPSMTAAGINAAGTKITNVTDGMQPRDAVNFGQLDAVNRNLGNSINELGYRIGEVEDDANAGISAAMAMSSLPQAYIIGKSMIGGGIATYNGESAVAIGFSKLSADGRWVMKLNGTADTQGNVGAAIGAGFHFD
ncbi:YadA-like family protein [Psychrobacter sp. S4(2024)]|uniref:YadA-like family protein n=1 Tax=Psychrobacter sp. S4(2024) TaxID=3111913 RepID=UPI0010569E9B